MKIMIVIIITIIPLISLLLSLSLLFSLSILVLLYNLLFLLRLQILLKLPLLQFLSLLPWVGRVWFTFIAIAWLCVPEIRCLALGPIPSPMDRNDGSSFTNKTIIKFFATNELKRSKSAIKISIWVQTLNRYENSSCIPCLLLSLSWILNSTLLALISTTLFINFAWSFS